jgi:hypothetical protein
MKKNRRCAAIRKPESTASIAGPLGGLRHTECACCLTEIDFFTASPRLLLHFNYFPGTYVPGNLYVALIVSPGYQNVKLQHSRVG